MRIFVAMDIPREVRDALAAFAVKLRPMAPSARWTRLEGVHITLKFIGEAPAEKLTRIETELAGVRSPEQVGIRFRGAGFFPDERRPRVFWAGCEASPNLAGLAAEIDARLKRLGIPAEKREFRPHLTLARFDSAGAAKGLLEALHNAEPVEFGTMASGEFHLYESELKLGGAAYTRLKSFPFVEARG